MISAKICVAENFRCDCTLSQKYSESLQKTQAEGDA